MSISSALKSTVSGLMGFAGNTIRALYGLKDPTKPDDDSTYSETLSSSTKILGSIFEQMQKVRAQEISNKSNEEKNKSDKSKQDDKFNEELIKALSVRRKPKKKRPVGKKEEPIKKAEEKKEETKPPEKKKEEPTKKAEEKKEEVKQTEKKTEEKKEETKPKAEEKKVETKPPEKKIEETKPKVEELKKEELKKAQDKAAKDKADKEAASAKDKANKESATAKDKSDKEAAAAKKKVEAESEAAKKTAEKVPAKELPKQTAEKIQTKPPVTLPKIDLDATKKMIIQHEGKVNFPYKDSKGLWTIGVGHLIGNGKTLPAEYDAWKNNGGPYDKNNNKSPAMTDEQVMALFEKDFESHKKMAEKTPGWNLANESGQAAMIDLAYNLGGSWYKSWKDTSAALESGDFEKAANGLKNSKWYEQVKGRAVKIVDMIRNGKKTEAEQKSVPVSTPQTSANKIEDSSKENKQLKEEATPQNQTIVNNRTVQPTTNETVVVNGNKPNDQGALQRKTQ